MSNPNYLASIFKESCLILAFDGTIDGIKKSLFTEIVNKTKNGDFKF